VWLSTNTRHLGVHRGFAEIELAKFGRSRQVDNTFFVLSDDLDPLTRSM